MTQVKFFKVQTVAQEGLTTGGIYFEKSTGLIKVATSATATDVFGGDVKDAVWDGTEKTLTISFNSGKSNVVLDFKDVASATGVNSLLAALRTDINANDARLDKLEGAASVTGSVAQKIQTAINALDTSSDVTVASKSGNVVTITGSIKEENGIVKKGSASNITLAAVATTGKASDVSVSGVSGITATNVSSALAELAAASSGGVDSKTVYIVASGSTGDYAQVYDIYQGPSGSTESPVAGEKIGTINIPKDKVVESGSVKTVTTANKPYSGAKVGDKYIELVLQNVANPLYIPVKELTDVYTAGNGLSLTGGTFSAKVASSADGNEFLSVDSKGLKVSGVSSAIATAKSEVIGSNADTATAETIYGAKAYADSVVAGKNVSASGDAYVSATASNNTVTVTATSALETAVTNANTALQGVSTAAAGTNVKVTLGKNNKNVTVSVDESGLTTALGNKADKVSSATSGNFAGLDANGNLTDSGKKAGDFATSAQGTKADSAIQSVSGQTAVSNSDYVAVSVEASTNSTTKKVTLTSHANVTTHTVSDAATGANGLATALDVKTYVDSQLTSSLEWVAFS